jgi:chromatin segregation and condensation protein Rec8/ScpA/Scc1 (kleisin family)
MTLLAGLELTRRRRIKLRQVKMFSELWIYSGVEEGEDSAKGHDSEAPGKGAAVGS